MDVPGEKGTTGKGSVERGVGLGVGLRVDLTSTTQPGQGVEQTWTRSETTRNE